jgi:hypothetical protein
MTEQEIMKKAEKRIIHRIYKMGMDEIIIKLHDDTKIKFEAIGSRNAQIRITEVTQ